MSTQGPFSAGGPLLNIWGPLNMESTFFQRKKARKMKMTSQTHKKCKKRKLEEILEDQGSNVSSSYCGGSYRKLEAPSQSLSDSADVVRVKRAKPTPLSVTCPLSSASMPSDSWELDSGFSSECSPPASGRSSPCVGMNPSMLVALDCEMVGTGPKGQCNELARCSILNYSGAVIYDKYIMPRQPVTNYRTRWSGIKKEHLVQALPYEEARQEILQILSGKVIIGHALHNDFMVLDIIVQRHMTRDTSRTSLLRQLCEASEKPVSLKKLANRLLHRTIQDSKSGHCSVEDARAALDLYKLVEEQWEQSIQTKVQYSYSTPESPSSLEHYMQDEYWPENLTDCNQ